jgi:RHS repeat-associated protein
LDAAGNRTAKTDYLAGVTSNYTYDKIYELTQVMQGTNTTESCTYDSFGNTTNSSGSLTNFFRYTAREFDTETGVYYYRARYYDPTTGRFLSEDPINFRGDSADFYLYVENDPTTSIDPYGLQHQPGGPYHAPKGKPIRCSPDDPCPVLLDKLEEFAHQLASHYVWDWTNGTNRHENDINQMWKGFWRCLSIYEKKCFGCQNQNPQPAPIPSQSPKATPLPIPFSPMPWETPFPWGEPVPIPEGGIPMDPVPIPIW